MTENIAKILTLSEFTGKENPDFAVYFICINDNLFYIGKSSGLSERLRCNFRARTADKIYFEECSSKDEMDNKEKAFIMFFRPEGNKQRKYYFSKSIQDIIEDLYNRVSYQNSN